MVKTPARIGSFGVFATFFAGLSQLAACVLTLLLMTTHAWAGYKDGERAYAAKDFATTYREWLPLAEAGDACAQYVIGHMYAIGQGLTRDTTEALRWYRRAAEQGHARAQWALGFTYFYNPGYDKTEGVSWIRRAAEQGLPGPQARLGETYANGVGVTKDLVRAYMRFDVAARSFPAESDRSKAASKRDEVGRLLSPPEIERAQRMSMDFQPKNEMRQKETVLPSSSD